MQASPVRLLFCTRRYVVGSLMHRSCTTLQSQYLARSAHDVQALPVLGRIAGLGERLGKDRVHRTTWWLHRLQVGLVLLRLSRRGTNLQIKLSSLFLHE